jgi:DNA invertase Pin-like site-specific DNA recombinase
MRDFASGEGRPGAARRLLNQLAAGDVVTVTRLNRLVLRGKSCCAAA